MTPSGPVENLRYSVEVLPPDESRIEQVVARLEDLTAGQLMRLSRYVRAIRQAGHLTDDHAKAPDAGLSDADQLREVLGLLDELDAEK